ncbi:MAG: hypothetical protein PHE03_00915 [Bacteroidales bacterium]|nr:hypothetical protein [Bacteroidales bacterium]MDD3890848.1 hypothetical protein [Bacteroidales bacterium]
MNQRIKYLLEKYYNGETSIGEEALLRRFFKEQKVPEALIPDRDMFLMTSEQPKVDDEVIVKEILSETHKWQQIEANRRKINGYRAAILSSAATIALAIGLTLFFTINSNTKSLVDTFDDPKMALLETQRVLALVGSKIIQVSDGLEPLDHLQIPLNSFKTFDRFSKGLSYLNMVEEIRRPEDIIDDIFGTESKSKNNQLSKDN